ncbi:glycosyltransferase family 2 protein [Spiractinospora alimapuensis]|uniref:glycosyltransferase family 2 protein n=1 Tax=Spiractinospora alimapuensis TaxID=2820884 RepID=UPI001F2F5C3E|nr:glycosyltransferase family 2 protein [Spiractinospora alimapuensis]QVQ50328.1 glycosyltransferase family 2 protein [Spiractinospora alimapuensis]
MRTARVIGRSVGALIAATVAVVLAWQWASFAIATLGAQSTPVLFFWLALGVNLAVWAMVGLVRCGDDGTRALIRRLRGERGAQVASTGRHRRGGTAPVLMMSATGESTEMSSGGAPTATLVRPEPSGHDGEADPNADITLSVIIAAHNEEPVINAAIRSALRLFDRRDIYVVSDSSRDYTADIAAQTGVNILELLTNRGKAGAIEALITEFQLVERYDGVVILDADTELDENYVRGAKAQLRDPKVAAVAGFVVAEWNPQERSLVGRAISAYRDRLYFMLQYLIRFGQTWRFTSVPPIVPGFASLYRTSALRRIDINPQGLVIEDFNMTFEVHRKALGRISMRPRTRAVCQDPYNLNDYLSQVRRWSLGFWQTIRRHGVWPSFFWFALFFYILELLLVSVVLITTAVLAVFTALPPLTNGAVLESSWYAAGYDQVTLLLPLVVLASGLFVPDYVLTCVMATIRGRPAYLVYGLFFLGFRLVDSFLALRTIPQAWTTRSDGQWKSPGRAVRA